MMTLLKPSSAKPRMFCSVQREPLVQISGMDAPLGRVADHGAKVLVRQRFSADKEQIADVVLDRDVNHIARLFPSDRTPAARVEFVHREIAKIAAGIADIGDGELQIIRGRRDQALRPKGAKTIFSV